MLELPVKPDALRDERPTPLRVVASDNVLDTGPDVLGFLPRALFAEGPGKPLAEGEAYEALRRLLAWEERRNVSQGMKGYLCWRPEADVGTAVHDLKTVNEWAHFWGAAEHESREGKLAYAGGSLKAKAHYSAGQFSPEDFRQAAGSIGKRMGPGGRDAGADVSLVGPGAGYEAWKKTAAYQAWREATGQR
jgi:hypothetical protein